MSPVGAGGSGAAVLAKAVPDHALVREDRRRHRRATPRARRARARRRRAARRGTALGRARRRRRAAPAPRSDCGSAREHVERGLRPAFGELEPREQHGARLLLRGRRAVARFADAAPRERRVAIVGRQARRLQQELDAIRAARRGRELRVQIRGRGRVARFDGRASALLERRGVARRPLRRRHRRARRARREQRDGECSGCATQRACKLAVVHEYPSSASMTDTREDRGKLYVVGTPIGNVDDLSPRARDVLAKADVIAAEDTRHTRGLLSRIGVESRLIAYHEHNEAERVPALLEQLARGESVALVSDAGTPLISDPGWRLVNAAQARGHRGRAGARAVRRDRRARALRACRPITSCSKGSCRGATGARAERLRRAARRARARIVFYEAVHRVAATLRGIARGVRRRAPRGARARAHEDSRADRDGHAWPSSTRGSASTSRCSANS